MQSIVIQKKFGVSACHTTPPTGVIPLQSPDCAPSYWMVSKVCGPVKLVSTLHGVSTSKLLVPDMYMTPVKPPLGSWASLG